MENNDMEEFTIEKVDKDMTKKIIETKNTGLLIAKIGLGLLSTSCSLAFISTIFGNNSLSNIEIIGSSLLSGLHSIASTKIFTDIYKDSDNLPMNESKDEKEIDYIQQFYHNHKNRLILFFLYALSTFYIENLTTNYIIIPELKECLDTLHNALGISGLGLFFAANCTFGDIDDMEIGTYHKSK